MGNPTNSGAPLQNIDECLALLEGVKPSGPNKWMAFCPVHGDHKRQSLSVTLEDNKILLHCFAGCQTEAIAQALKLTMADLFLDKKERPEPKVSPPRERKKLVKGQQAIQAVVNIIVARTPGLAAARTPENEARDGGSTANV